MSYCKNEKLIKSIFGTILVSFLGADISDILIKLNAIKKNIWKIQVSSENNKNHFLVILLNKNLISCFSRIIEVWINTSSSGVIDKDISTPKIISCTSDRILKLFIKFQKLSIINV